MRVDSFSPEEKVGKCQNTSCLRDRALGQNSTAHKEPCKMHGMEHAIMQCMNLFWAYVTGQTTGAAA